MYDIPVLHHIRLALQPVNAMALGFLHGTQAFEIRVADHLAADETSGKVGVDFAGAFDVPGALLLSVALLSLMVALATASATATVF